MAPGERREQLLDAAMEIIVREGYGGISIDAIAREAGVTRPVVYGVFEGLTPLLYALLDRQEQRALEQLARLLPLDLESRDPDALVETTVQRMVELIRDDPLTWRPIVFLPSDSPEAVRERIERDRDVVRGQLAAMLETGLKLSGGPQLDTEVLSHALLAILEHFARVILDEPERFDTDRLVATVQGVLASLRR